MESGFQRDSGLQIRRVQTEEALAKPSEISTHKTRHQRRLRFLAALRRVFQEPPICENFHALPLASIHAGALSTVV
jgi:hypothetical protein